MSHIKIDFLYSYCIVHLIACPKLSRELTNYWCVYITTVKYQIKGHFTCRR